MGDSVQSSKQKIICCPLCGEKIPDGSKEEKCFACNFNFELLQVSEPPSALVTIPPDIPLFAFAMVGIQVILAGVLGIFYLLFANPYYFGLPQMIIAIQFTSIVILILFALVLFFRKAIVIVRIGLVILGLFTLPIGICAFAAAFSIAPQRRWCIICGKQISWTSFLECPHCQVSMHQWGRCRSDRFQRVAASPDYEPLQSQIEHTCPTCLKAMNQQSHGGTPDD